MFSEHAMFLSMLAEKQDRADEAVEKQLKTVLREQQKLRDAIEFRDTLNKVRAFLRYV